MEWCRGIDRYLLSSDDGDGYVSGSCCRGVCRVGISDMILLCLWVISTCVTRRKRRESDNANLSFRERHRWSTHMITYAVFWWAMRGWLL